VSPAFDEVSLFIFFAYRRLRFSLDQNLLVVGYDVAMPPPMSVRERRLIMSCNIVDLHSIHPAVIGVSIAVLTLFTLD